MAAGDINTLVEVEQELLQIADEVEQATGLDQLRPMFNRLNQLARHNLGDPMVQARISQVQARVVSRGNMLQTEPKTAADLRIKRPLETPRAARVAPASEAPIPQPPFPRATPPPPAAKDSTAPPSPPPPTPEQPRPEAPEVLALIPTRPIEMVRPLTLDPPAIDVKAERVDEARRPRFRPRGWAPRGSTVQMPRRLPSRRLTVVAGILMGVSTVVGLIRIFHRPDSILGGQVPVHIRTVPPGARLTIDGRVAATDAPVPLRPGEHRLEASLDGYQTASSTIRVNAEKPAEAVIELRPSPVSLQIHSDLAAGQVFLSGKLAGELRAGEWKLRDLPAGEHQLKVVSGMQQMELGFRITAGETPSWTSPLHARNVYALAAGNAGRRATLLSSVAGLPLKVNDKTAGTFAVAGLGIDEVYAGDHELIIGEGSSTRKFQAGFGASPTLHFFLQASTQTGALLVATSEDDAEVTLNGRPQSRHTQDGRLRLALLPPGDYLIGARKKGFHSPAEQLVSIRRGQEARVELRLQPGR